MGQPVTGSVNVPSPFQTGPGEFTEGTNFGIIAGSELDPEVIEERRRQRAEELYNRVVKNLQRRGFTSTNDFGRDSAIGVGESASALGHAGLDPGNTGRGLLGLIGTAIGGPIGLALGAAATLGPSGSTTGVMGTIAGLLGLQGGTAPLGSFGNVGVGGPGTPSNIGGYEPGRGPSAPTGRGDVGGVGAGGLGVGAPGVGAGEGGGGPGGGPCCFVAGTQIAMEHHGVMNIEDVKPGHIVQSYNLRSQLFNHSIVRSVKTVHRDDYYELRFDFGPVLKVTDDHPLWTEDGWASIKPDVTGNNPLYDNLQGDVEMLTEGNSIMTINGNYATIQSITRVEGPIKTYTLGNVSPARNFFANGYLASNYAC